MIVVNIISCAQFVMEYHGLPEHLVREAMDEIVQAGILPAEPLAEDRAEVL